MGAWGAGLYQNDYAADLRHEFRRLARLPVSGAELAAAVAARNPPSGDPSDEEYTVFWLTLADQLHHYGIEDAKTFAIAARIIDDGADDRVMAELEMSARDLAKRRQALLALRSKWAEPNPKPAGRKLLKAPEPFATNEGDIWAYPTQDGNPPNTFFPASYIAETFKPDGWAAFATVANRHQLGYFAASFVVRLHVDGPEMPEIEACRGAAVSGVKHYIAREEQPLAHVAGWVQITGPVLKKMRARKIGSAAFDIGKVAQRVNGFEQDEQREPRSLCGVLQCWQRMLGTTAWLDYAAPLEIRMPDPMAAGSEFA